MTQLPVFLLPNTEQLIMTGNDLKAINHVSKDFPHLKTIDMERSNISEISTLALQALLSHSQNLKLSGNKIHHMSSVLHTGGNQTNLWFSRNPLQCNCDMMWMKDWLVNATNVMDKENITCVGGKWNGRIFQ